MALTTKRITLALGLVVSLVTLALFWVYRAPSSDPPPVVWQVTPATVQVGQSTIHVESVLGWSKHPSIEQVFAEVERLGYRTSVPLAPPPDSPYLMVLLRTQGAAMLEDLAVSLTLTGGESIPPILFGKVLDVEGRLFAQATFLQFDESRVVGLEVMVKGESVLQSVLHAESGR